MLSHVSKINRLNIDCDFNFYITDAPQKIDKLKQVHGTDIILVLMGENNADNNINKSIKAIFVDESGVEQVQWKVFGAICPPISGNCARHAEDDHAADCTCLQCEQERDADNEMSD